MAAFKAAAVALDQKRNDNFDKKIALLFSEMRDMMTVLLTYVIFYETHLCTLNLAIPP